MVFNNPAPNNFEPKEKRGLMALFEKTALGSHFEKNQSNRVLKKFWVNDWITKAQTPYPLYARVIPTAPPIIIEVSDALVWVLKSRLTVSLVRWMIAKELMMIFILMTLVNNLKVGSWKKYAICPAEKYRIKYIINPVSILKKR